MNTLIMLAVLETTDYFRTKPEDGGRSCLWNLELLLITSISLLQTIVESIKLMSVDVRGGFKF